jgi:hypothetical protein
VAAESGASGSTARRTAASAMARAARAWIDGLDPSQVGRAVLAGPRDPVAEAERLKWYYTPTDHGGLALGDQSPSQQRMAMRLLSTGTSRSGYATIATVIGLENVLDELEGWQVDWGRERGRDPGLYWLRVFGAPEEQAWGWRFGGHHVSVNVLVVDGQVVSSTPCFIGADPADTELLGSRLRPLGGPHDLGLELVSSFGRDARRVAVIHERAVSDIVTGNRTRVADGAEMMHMQDLWRGRFAEARLRHVVDRIDEVAEAGSRYTRGDHARVAVRSQPAGLAGVSMSASQRELLRELIGQFTGRAPTPMTVELAARYADDEVLDSVHFAWAGAVRAGGPAYYRIQGPNVLIEYDNTQRDSNHAHSVWRDPESDFGLDALRAHLDRAHR